MPPESTIIGSVNAGRDTYIGSTIYQQAAPATPTATHSIPAPIGDFVGRAEEIESLVAELSKAASGGMAASISGMRGLGGVGKTQTRTAVALPRHLNYSCIRGVFVVGATPRRPTPPP